MHLIINLCCNTFSPLRMTEKLFEFKIIALIPMLNYYLSQKLKSVLLDAFQVFNSVYPKLFSLAVCFL
jgi:hypothetical protein